MGTTVNIAQRLASIAIEDQIVISQKVYDAVHALFVYQDIGNVNLKHVHKPIEVCQLVK